MHCIPPPTLVLQGFRFAAISIAALVAGCGGGGSASISGDEGRVAAVNATAQSAPACQALTPFYWEIGDRSGALGSGQIGAGAPSGSTIMTIASSSKWLYGAYVAERRAGNLGATADVPYLNFTSGYSNFDLPLCGVAFTVADCLSGDRGTRNDVEAAGRLYHYDSAHMQVHALSMGLGPLSPSALATEVRSRLGTDIQLTYAEPQLAGGVNMSAEAYARFLRKLLIGSPTPLRMGGLLGSNAVCTLPGRCPTAVFSPSQDDWHYSMGHWVEDDPRTSPPGDGSFSSPGAFGFYPWVDATRQWYGVLARESTAAGHGGMASARCGRLLREAWRTGQAQ